MILVIDATATDPEGNVLSGSVAVTVNTPAVAPAQEQVAATTVSQAQADLGMGDFQRRSIMMLRQGGA
jgi:hypothetical protein